jgi:hypothetical protein
MMASNCAQLKILSLGLTEEAVGPAAPAVEGLRRRQKQRPELPMGERVGCSWGCANQGV